MQQAELHLVGGVPGGMLAQAHRQQATGMAGESLCGIREETRQAGNGGTETEGGRGMATITKTRVGNKAAAGRFALGRLKTGERNKTEQAYEDYLTLLQRAGKVVWFKFEGVKLRLADNTFYTPDYAVMLDSGQMEMHEVKGFWQDDARAKIKIAAELYPFRFLAAKPKSKKDGGGWEIEVFE